MKKITMFFTSFIAMVAMMVVTVIPVNAIEAPMSDPLKGEHSMQVGNIDNTARYYGWNVEVKGKSESLDKIVSVATVSNSKYQYIITVTSKRNSKGDISSTLKIGGKKYPFESVKAGFKKYSISKDIRKMLKEQAANKAKVLTDYGKKYWWKVTKKATFKNVKANQSLTFKNDRYQFNATVRAGRKGGKIVFDYLRQGEKSSSKAIKEWLKQYHIPFHNDK